MIVVHLTVLGGILACVAVKPTQAGKPVVRGMAAGLLPPAVALARTATGAAAVMFIEGAEA